MLQLTAHAVHYPHPIFFFIVLFEELERWPQKKRSLRKVKKMLNTTGCWIHKEFIKTFNYWLPWTNLLSIQSRGNVDVMQRVHLLTYYKDSWNDWATWTVAVCSLCYLVSSILTDILIELLLGRYLTRPTKWVEVPSDVFAFLMDTNVL